MQIRGHRRAVLILAPLIVLAAGCSGDDPAAAGPGPTATATATGTSEPGPDQAAEDGAGGGEAGEGEAGEDAAGEAPTGPAPAPAPGATGEPEVAISKAPAVKVGGSATITSEVRVTIGRIRGITVGAEQPGEIKGSAAAVAVTVKNDSGAEFSLDGMVVTASYGDDLPGDQTTSGPSEPMTGTLAPGKSASGTYVFMVPKAELETLRLEISSDQSPTIVQFDR